MALTPSLPARYAGYTFVELMVVVAVIGSLAAISLANFAQFQRTASDKVAQSDYVNLKKVVYGAISESESSPYYLYFGLRGPRMLPAPLGSGALSQGVRLTYVLRLRLFGGRELIAFDLQHENGGYRFRYLEIDGSGIDQVIRLRR